MYLNDGLPFFNEDDEDIPVSVVQEPSPNAVEETSKVTV